MQAGFSAFPGWRIHASREWMHAMRLLLPITFVFAALLPACGQTPAAAEKKPEVKTVSDFKDWKQQDTGPEAKVEIKPELAEPNPAKDAKPVELNADAKKAGVLILKAGAPFCAVKYEGKEELLARTGYEISWDAMRVEGSDFFSALTFPVLKKNSKGEDINASLVTGGWGGWVVGISSVGHQFASENETTRSYEFETGRWYRFTVQVTPQVIRCLIGGKEQFKLDTRDKTLSMHPSEIQKCEPLGFSTYQTTGAIRNVQIRALKDGEVKPDDIPE
jgi:hypothetical protein